MKAVSINHGSDDVSSLLDQARREDILVRAPDGTEFLITVVNDFDAEIVRTRRNDRLMRLLEERARQPVTTSLDEVRKELGLD